MILSKSQAKLPIGINRHCLTGCAIGEILGDEPDLRSWSIRDNGQRDVALVLGGPDQAAVTGAADRTLLR